MKDERRMVRQYRLQKFVRLLSGRYDVIVTLPEEQPEMFKHGMLKDRVPYYGFSDTDKNIFINPKIDRDPYENLIQQKAVSLHELGHILYTDGQMWLDSGVNRALCNIIEDGRVEEAISRDFPKARKYFYYLNEKISDKGLIPKNIMANTEMLLADYMLRIAKMPTGMEPPDTSNINKLKKKLKDDFEFFTKKTIQAVNAPSEKEAIKITAEIEEKWLKLFGNKKKFPSIARTPFSSIAQQKNKRGKSRPMPPQMPRNKTEKQKEMEKKVKNQTLGEGAETDRKDTKKVKPSSKGEIESKDISGKGKKKGKGKGTGETEEKDKKGKGENKSAKQLHKELKEEAKKELNKESKEEYGTETKEMNKGNIKGNFSSYKNVKTGGKEREPIYTAPLDALARKIHHKFRIIAQTGKGWKRNQPRGKIDSSNLYKVPTSKNNCPRVFKSIKQKDKTDISAIILLDISGSMGQQCQTAIEATYVIARALELGHFNSEIVGFGDGYGGLRGIKSFNQSTLYAKKNFCPMADGGTPLFIALEGAQKSLSGVDSKRKIIFVVTDGEPNTGGGPDECKQKILEIEKEGIDVVGLLISIDDEYHLFNSKRRFRIDDVREIPTRMTAIIKGVLLTIKR